MSDNLHVERQLASQISDPASRGQVDDDWSWSEIHDIQTFTLMTDAGLKSDIQTPTLMSPELL